MGDPVFASEGFYAGVHDGAGIYGSSDAGVSEAEYEGDRAECRPGVEPWKMGGGYRGDAGVSRDVSDDRRSGIEDREVERHAAGRCGEYFGRPHGGDECDGADGV